MKFPKRLRPGFTLIELLVVIAIIAILASILFPVFSRARESARQTACRSNVKQVVTALTMYAQDYDEALPLFAAPVPGPQYYWPFAINPYVRNSALWKCPSDPLQVNVLDTNNPLDDTVTYGFNYRFLSGMSLAGVQKPADTVASLCTNYYAVEADQGQYRHNEFSNIGFMDGHVKSLRRTQCELQADFEDGVDLTPGAPWTRFVLWNLQ